MAYRIARACLVLAGLTAALAAGPALARNKFPGMTKADSRVRERLVFSVQPLSRVPAYAPHGACTFLSKYRYANGKEDERNFTLRIAAVASARNRLLVTSDYGSYVSTAVIGLDGRLFDFNFVSPDGTRATSDTWPAQARQIAARDGTQGQVVNNFTMAFPAFAQHAWQPGDAVATVMAEDGSVWASYIYRGVGGVGVWPAAILDLVRPASAGGQTVGYSIVEISSMVPLLVVARTRYNDWRFERLSCQ